MLLVLPGCADEEGDLPRPYRRLPVPSERLASTEARERGGTLFAVNCALCHGQRGDGRGARRQWLSGSPRDFTSAAWRASTSPRRVFFAIREGVSGTSMPAWPGLSEGDAWDLTAYVLWLGERP
jgi:mono/diheme cytochrome c family protein